MNLKQAENYALNKMIEHGLIVSEGRFGTTKEQIIFRNWSFEFDNAISRFGVCRYKPRKITVSRELTLRNSDSEVMDTILHEIAHALTPGAGHGPKWKAKCIEIGAKPERCYDIKRVDSPEGKYNIECPSCGQTWNRHTRSKLWINAERYKCRKCKVSLIRKIK